MQQYLQSDLYFDFNKPQLLEYSKSLVKEDLSPRELVKRLYLGVRDDIQYNAYTFNPQPTHFSASHCLSQGESYCIPKAVLLAALCRLNGIPARLGLADVKNHLASPQFLEYLKSDVFVMHGYTDIFLDGKWVKATPAFDKKLCALMNVDPLEFDGTQDSVFHEFDNGGARHMEYLNDHGVFASVPREQIVMAIAEAYPHLASTQMRQLSGRSMHKDMEQQ